LVRSTKTEHRLRQRARIVLLAADGTASRAIGRAVGCTTGTASKWRVHGAAFTSVKQLSKHIDAFIEAYNENAKPFVWTKAEVHQKRLKPRFADQ
jgi:hypothetical protein